MHIAGDFAIIVIDADIDDNGPFFSATPLVQNVFDRWRR